MRIPPNRETTGLGSVHAGAATPLASGVAAPAWTLPKPVVSRLGGILKKMSGLSAFGGLDEQTFEMGCHYWYIDSQRAIDELEFSPRDWSETLSETVAEIRGIGALP